ncbi:MAG: hypothetical protein IKM33_00380, partial [Clostridia bacterium]|nr:hypothetical protein [Clostridia bacterium]
FRQSKQKAARIVDPIRRIFVTNDGKDSVDSLCEGFLEVPCSLSGRGFTPAPHQEPFAKGSWNSKNLKNLFMAND